MKCTLCERETNKTHDHHLIPKKFARKKGLLKDPNNKISLCSDCNKTIHATLPLKQLEKTHNTIEKLKQHPQIASYITWVKTRPLGIVKHPKRSWNGGKYD
jgi:5-methylcytosine-specific restriction endonuclease McrA